LFYFTFFEKFIACNVGIIIGKRALKCNVREKNGNGKIDKML
jgi:hypothetical protein